MNTEIEDIIGIFSRAEGESSPAGRAGCPVPYHAGQPGEKPPEARLGLLLKQVRHLYSKVCAYQGSSFNGAVKDIMQTALLKACGCKSPSRNALELTLQDYTGLDLDDKVLASICYKTIEYRSAVRAGQYAIPWRDHAVPVWCLFRCVSAEREKAQPGKAAMLQVGLLCMTGLPAGSVIHARMSSGVVRQFLRELGLPKREKLDDREIYGMQFQALLGKDPHGREAMLQYHIPGSLADLNRKLHKQRENCPRNYGWFCGECPLGRDKCPAALKDKSWPKAFCVNGHKGWFRPGEQVTECLACRAKKKAESQIKESDRTAPPEGALEPTKG